MQNVLDQLQHAPVLEELPQEVSVQDGDALSGPVEAAGVPQQAVVEPALQTGAGDGGAEEEGVERDGDDGHRGEGVGVDEEVVVGVVHGGCWLSGFCGVFVTRR